MVEEGLVEEVKELLAKGYDKNSTAMQGIGYKEFYGYLGGIKTLEETREEIKQGSRRYAKRQLTWFRKNENVKNILILRLLLTIHSESSIMYKS